MSESDEPITAIDSNTLGWIAKRKGIDDDKEMCRRAKILFNAFDRKRTPVVISTIVVAEYLRPVEDEDHDRTLAALQAMFRVHPFDAKAAVIAASIWRRYLRHIADLKQVVDEKQRLKSDLHIVASSISGGARKFYSHDERARKLAELGGIRACNLPTHAEQLFDELD